MVGWVKGSDAQLYNYINALGWISG